MLAENSVAPDGRGMAGPGMASEPPNLHCIFSYPHLAVHLRQELIQKFLPVLLLPTHLGHQFLHHVIQLLCSGIKLDPAHFGRQGALVGFLRGRPAWGGDGPRAVCLRLPSHPLPSPPNSSIPIPPTLAEEEPEAHLVNLHLQVLSVGLFLIEPFYPLIQHLEANGTEKAKESVMTSPQGWVGQAGPLQLLTSMSFCFCRWSSIRLLVVMLSFSQSPWTCRMALCTWPSSSSSCSSDGSFWWLLGQPMKQSHG